MKYELCNTCGGLGFMDENCKSDRDAEEWYFDCQGEGVIECEGKDEDLIKLAAQEPQTVETAAAALQRTIDFQKGRGRMLAQLRPDSQVARANAEDQ